MDGSIILKHLRCCRLIGQFFGRELASPGLTNFKTFLIGTACLRLTAHFIQSGGCCWIPSPLMNGLWCFSFVTVAMEGLGMVVRCFQLYCAYFSLCPYDPGNPFDNSHSS